MSATLIPRQTNAVDNWFKFLYECEEGWLLPERWEEPIYPLNGRSQTYSFLYYHL